MVEVAKRIEYIDQNEHREKLKKQAENKEVPEDLEDDIKKEIMDLSEDQFEPIKDEEDSEEDSYEDQEFEESEDMGDEELDEDFDEDPEEEFFVQNPLRAIWIKEKEISEKLDYLINSLMEEDDGEQ